MTGETGSYRYMAPEVFRHEPYNSKVDVRFSIVTSSCAVVDNVARSPAAVKQEYSAMERGDCGVCGGSSLHRTVSEIDLVSRSSRRQQNRFSIAA
jgi:serine/threonine protein kinase